MDNDSFEMKTSNSEFGILARKDQGGNKLNTDAIDNTLQDIQGGNTLQNQHGQCTLLNGIQNHLTITLHGPEWKYKDLERNSIKSNISSLTGHFTVLLEPEYSLKVKEFMDRLSMPLPITQSEYDMLTPNSCSYFTLAEPLGFPFYESFSMLLWEYNQVFSTKKNVVSKQTAIMNCIIARPFQAHEGLHYNYEYDYLWQFVTGKEVYKYQAYYAMCLVTTTNPTILGFICEKKTSQRSKDQDLIKLAFACKYSSTIQQHSFACGITVAIYINDTVVEVYFGYYEKASSEYCFELVKVFDCLQLSDCYELHRMMWNLSLATNKQLDDLDKPDMDARLRDLATLETFVFGVNSHASSKRSGGPSDRCSSPKPKRRKESQEERRLCLTAFDQKVLLEHGFEFELNGTLELMKTDPKYSHIAHGKQLETKRKVIVKKVTSFSREIEMLEYVNALDSPRNRVVRLLDKIQVHDDTLLVFPWYPPMERTNLETKAIKLTKDMVYLINDQLEDTVRFMHENGVAHLDIKPQNLAFDQECQQIVLLDLDCSKRADYDTILYNRRGTEGFVPDEFWSEDRPFKAFELDDFGVERTIIWLAQNINI